MTPTKPNVTDEELRAACQRALKHIPIPGETLGEIQDICTIARALLLRLPDGEGVDQNLQADTAHHAEQARMSPGGGTGVGDTGSLPPVGPTAPAPPADSEALEAELAEAQKALRDAEARGWNDGIEHSAKIVDAWHGLGDTAAERIRALRLKPAPSPVSAQSGRE